MTYQRIKILINEVAVRVEGQRCIAYVELRRILGVGPSHFQYAMTKGRLHPIKISVTRTRAVTRGVVTYYPLDQVWPLVQARCRKHNQHWSDGQLRYLRHAAGVRTWARIARTLRRSPAACQRKFNDMGWHLADVLETEHRLLTTGGLARLMRRHRTAILGWVANGCPVALRCGRQQNLRFDLSAVRRWIAWRDEILVRMHPDTRRLMRLTPLHVEQIRMADDPVRGRAA